VKGLSKNDCAEIGPSYKPALYTQNFRDAGHQVTNEMATIRPMTPMDLLKFNPCNLDYLTETYNIGFYLEYFTRWPQLCKVIEGNNGQIEAYSK